MRLFLRVFTLGALLLAATVYLHSPHVTRALIDPRYTPPYWTH